MPRKEQPGPISAQAQQDLVSEGLENFELPKSIVTKIAKSGIPENAKLQKDTLLSLVKGSTVFINYLAATAHDVAVSKQHKSISASDVLKALEMLEFGDLVDQLQAELVIYRENAKGDKGKKSASSASINGTKSSHSISISIPPVSTSGSTIRLPPALPQSISAGKLKESKPVKQLSELGTPVKDPKTQILSRQSPLSGEHETLVGDGENSDRGGGPEEEAENEVGGYEDDQEMIGVDKEGEGDQSEEGEEDEYDDEENEDEEMEVDDPMAVEEEELRKDAKGLDEIVGYGDIEH